MKRLAAVTLAILGMAFTAFAQRGSSHAGMGGGFHGGGAASHSAPAFHGGAGPAGPRAGSGFRSAGPARFSGANSRAVPSRFARGVPMSRGVPVRQPANYGNRAPGRGPNGYDPNHGHRREYRSNYASPYGTNLVYGNGLWPGWIWPDSLGYSDDSSNDSGAYQNDPGDWYYPQPGDQQQPGDTARYYPPPPSPPSTAPEKEEAVTIIFKDGRAPERIHNFLLSRTSLSILDLPHREIPVDQLDLAATEKVNRGAGIVFELPSLSQ